MIRRVPEALAISIAVVVTFCRIVFIKYHMTDRFIDRIVSSDVFKTPDRSVTEFYICFMMSDVFLIRIIYQPIYKLKDLIGVDCLMMNTLTH